MDRTEPTTKPRSRATRTRHPSGQRVLAGIGAVMALEAVSLAVVAALHLSGQVHGRGKPFDPDHAGIAEAIIAGALTGGALAVFRASRHARVIALATTGFAIAGFGVGLTMTAQGGDLPDIAYHLTVLPMLIASLIVLAKADPSAFRSTDLRPDQQTPGSAVPDRLEEA
jgi:peptidoglycan/LPS O-acetylase OafA/YrhL